MLILHINTALGRSYTERFHMGSDMAIAKDEAEKRFHGRRNFGLPCESIAVKNAETKEILCTYDGEWK